MADIAPRFPLLQARVGVVIALFIASLCWQSCNTRRPERMASPRGYNLNKPERIKLPLLLDEISGLAYSSKDSSLFAINDERGELYRIRPHRPKEIERWDFAVGGDYEDLVRLPPYYFVLKSKGAVTVFRFVDSTTTRVENFELPPPEPSGNEFEAMWWDPELQRILILCKDCKSDKKDSSSIFALDPRTSTWSRAPFSVNVEEIASIQNKEEINFRPSAAAIHPITGELYIISSVNKLLVVASRKGNVKNIYSLDPGLFKQPEGIAFSPRGTLFISNEAADIGVANILMYRYHQVQNITPR